MKNGKILARLPEQPALVTYRDSESGQTNILVRNMVTICNTFPFDILLAVFGVSYRDITVLDYVNSKKYILRKY